MISPKAITTRHPRIFTTKKKLLVMVVSVLPTPSFLIFANTLVNNAVSNRLNSRCDSFFKLRGISKKVAPATIRLRLQDAKCPTAVVGRETTEYTFDNFSKIYAGDFCNNRQLLQQPDVQFARKLHVPIEVPQLGQHCFFVKEETRRDGRTQCRLRVAAFSRYDDPSAIVFKGKHYDFREPGNLEQDLTVAQYIEYVQVSDWRFPCITFCFLGRSRIVAERDE
jgi:hypothetical protein